MPRSNPSRPRRRNRWQALSPEELVGCTEPCVRYRLRRDVLAMRQLSDVVAVLGDAPTDEKHKHWKRRGD